MEVLAVLGIAVLDDRLRLPPTQGLLVFPAPPFNFQHALVGKFCGTLEVRTYWIAPCLFPAARQRLVSHENAVDRLDVNNFGRP